MGTRPLHSNLASRSETESREHSGTADPSTSLRYARDDNLRNQELKAKSQKLTAKRDLLHIAGAGAGPESAVFAPLVISSKLNCLLKPSYVLPSIST